MSMLTQKKNQIKIKSSLKGKGHEIDVCEGQAVFTLAKVLYTEEVTSTGASSLELTCGWKICCC